MKAKAFENLIIPYLWSLEKKAFVYFLEFEYELETAKIAPDLFRDFKRFIVNPPCP